MTPHRLFHAKTRRGIAPNLGAAVLVVDEAFYAGVTLLTLLAQVKLASPHLSIVLVGDPNQLLAPCNHFGGAEPPSFEGSDLLHWLCGGRSLRFTRCRRSDRQLFSLYTNPFPLAYLREILAPRHGELPRWSLCVSNWMRKKVN